MKASVCFIALLAALLPIAAFSQPTEIVVPVREFQPATPLETREPVYPATALQNNREGWVLVSFIVTEEGDVRDAIVEESRGDRAFERAALRAINQFKFNPAMENGVPVEQSIAQYIFSFNLAGGTDGARRNFVRRYQEIFQLIIDDELTEVPNLLDDLSENNTANHYENAWYNFLYYAYLERLPNSSRGEKISRLLAATDLYQLEMEGEEQGSYLLDDNYLFAIQNLMNLLLQERYYSRVLSEIDEFLSNTEITSHDNYEQVRDALLNVSNQIENLIDSPEAISFNGIIEEDNYWFYLLLRSSFSLERVSGEIESVDIRCMDGSTNTYDFVEDVRWRIPESLGECRLYIKGTPGSSVTVHEYPD